MNCVGRDTRVAEACETMGGVRASRRGSMALPARSGGFLALVAGFLLVPGCSLEGFLNRTDSLGGDSAGNRGLVGVIVINNTDARAIFTMGTYDDLDQFTLPDSELFGAESDGQRLEAGGDTGIMNMDCARVFSIGSAGLIDAIQNNDPDFPDALDEPALVPGVYFSSSSLDSLNAALPTAGFAAGFEARLGVDFPCDALLIVRLEIDDVGPEEFRVDFEIISP